MDRTVTLTAGRLGAVVLAALLVGAGSGLAATLALESPSAPSAGSNPPDTTNGSIQAFDSAEDFRAYLRAGQRVDPIRHDRTLTDVRARSVSPSAEPIDRPAAPESTPVSATPGDGNDATAIDRRTSRTNVEIAGIDEPDVLKTTADTVYYATRNAGPRTEPVEPRARPGVTDDGIARQGLVHLLDTTDPAAPAVASRINASGRLLLVDDTLVVLESNSLVGYDVSNRATPVERWSTSLSGRLVAARLFEGHLYTVTEQDVDGDDPCPTRPMPEVEVACTDIHHPVSPIPVDRIYSVAVMNPADGTTDDTAGFVAPAGQSVVSMSAESVYVTFPERIDRTEFLIEFLLTEQAHRLDDETLDRIREIRQYDLSPRASRYELQAALQGWVAGLDERERTVARDALRSDLQAWAADHRRDFQRTGIVEFALRGTNTTAPSVEPGATGSVPGRPLDQFALDEHEGSLRVATTVDGVYGTDSTNDVYVLNESLGIVGSVTDMGLTERIYSVRFRGDEAYVVTFRRIDPFHVLDLSEPTNPMLAGELKLPGFSSYLHPLGEDRVLGIGEEDGRVKLVVFDVADPSDPTIEDSRILDARWSAVARSHHAFLVDPRYQVFFLPAGEEGQIYRYDGGLERVTAVPTEGSARRAAYVGDYLYVFGDRSVTVVDETSWEPVHTLELI